MLIGPGQSEFWKPGSQILQQDVWWGQHLSSRPETVVDDRTGLLALYTHPNAPYRSASAFRGNRHSLSLDEKMTVMIGLVGPFEVRISSNNHVLTLTPPRSRHSVWLFWTVDWELKFWYVNLQAPIQRTERGIVVQDHVLDIVVKPDMSWSWKDDDEFTELHRRHFFSDQQASSIREEGERMVEAIERVSPPFCDGWENWRADPEWTVPEIPVDWDIIDHRLLNGPD